MVSLHRRVAGFAGGVLAATALFVAVAPAASAACHAFRIQASPTRAAEGTSVTVTVSRDGAVDPSSIDVSSVDETATAGADYPVVQRTISFTNEVQQSFAVPITDDAADEGDESFRLHLSNPGGCGVNPYYDVGPDAVVTIAASDAPPPPTAAPPTTATQPPTTAAPPGTASPAPTSSPSTSSAEAVGTTATTDAPPDSSTTSASSTSSSSVARTTTTIADQQLALDGAAEDDAGGGGGWLVILALGIVIMSGLGGWWVVRRRGVGIET